MVRLDNSAGYGGRYPPVTVHIIKHTVLFMDTSTFLQTHRVFSLDEAVRALDPAGGRKATLERLKYAARRGKVKRLARGTYASIPAGVNPAKFQPDRFLAAVALRPDAVFVLPFGARATGRRSFGMALVYGVQRATCSAFHAGLPGACGFFPIQSPWWHGSSPS